MGYEHKKTYKRGRDPTELPKIIEQWKDTLDLLVEGCKNNEIVVLRAAYPKTVRWYLYEAINAARELGLEPYASINVKLKMTKEKGIFYAHPNPVKASLEVTSIGRLGVEEAIRVKDVPGVSSLAGVISSFLSARLLKNIDALRFPDFEPSLIDKVKVWATNIGHEVLSEAPLTIKRYVPSDDASSG